MADVGVDRRIKTRRLVDASNSHLCGRHEVRVVMHDVVDRFAPLFNSFRHKPSILRQITAPL